MGLNATDMFAGRQNQQKAYLNDFSNNQVSNLASIGSGYLANKTAAEGAGLQAVQTAQLAKQTGNGWTDFTSGLGDFINAVTGIASAISGFIPGGGGGGGTNLNGQTSHGGYGPPSGMPPVWQPWNPNQVGAQGFNTPLYTPPAYDYYQHSGRY